MRLPRQRLANDVLAGYDKYPAFTGNEPCVEHGIAAYCYDGDMSDERAAELKAVCNTCPLFRECLAWALRNERHYFWAGTRPHERDALRRMFNIQLRHWEHA